MPRRTEQGVVSFFRQVHRHGVASEHPPRVRCSSASRALPFELRTSFFGSTFTTPTLTAGSLADLDGEPAATFSTSAGVKRRPGVACAGVYNDGHTSNLTPTARIGRRAMDKAYAANRARHARLCLNRQRLTKSYRRWACSRLPSAMGYRHGDRMAGLEMAHTSSLIHHERYQSTLGQRTAELSVCASARAQHHTRSRPTTRPPGSAPRQDLNLRPRGLEGLQH